MNVECFGVCRLGQWGYVDGTWKRSRTSVKLQCDTRRQLNPARRDVSGSGWGLEDGVRTRDSRETIPGFHPR